MLYGLTQMKFGRKQTIGTSQKKEQKGKQTLDNNRIVVADFICPTEQTRTDFDADYVIWMDTIKEGRFEDMNKMFEEPTEYNTRVTSKDAEMWAYLITQELRDLIWLERKSRG
jgi:adenylylsulfate kinase